MICTSLHPPALHPPDGMQAPLKIPTPYMLTAMLNNLDYTQGHRQNPVSRKIFSRPVPLGPRDAPLHASNRAFRHLIPLWRNAGEEAGVSRGLVKWSAKGGCDAPDEPCLHRVLHELRLLPPGRQSGGRDRAEARHLPS